MRPCGWTKEPPKRDELYTIMIDYHYNEEIRKAKEYWEGLLIAEEQRMAIFIQKGVLFAYKA